MTSYANAFILAKTSNLSIGVSKYLHDKLKKTFPNIEIENVDSYADNDRENAAIPNTLSKAHLKPYRGDLIQQFLLQGELLKTANSIIMVHH